MEFPLFGGMRVNDFAFPKVKTTKTCFLENRMLKSQQFWSIICPLEVFCKAFSRGGIKKKEKSCFLRAALIYHYTNGSYIICLLLGNFVVCYTLSCYLQITIFENDVPSPLFIFAYYSERAAYHNSEIMKDVHYKKRFTKLMPIEWDVKNRSTILLLHLLTY